MGWMDRRSILIIRYFVLRNFNINTYYYTVECDRVIVTSSSNGVGKNKDLGKKYVINY